MHRLSIKKLNDMNTKLLLVFSVLLFMVGCGQTTYTLPSVSGSKFEVLVVIDNQVWNAEAGQKLSDILKTEMVAMPQSEASMRVSQCNAETFTDFLKPSRNIVLVNIDEKYTSPKIIFTRNVWAQPQSVVRINAPSESALLTAINQQGTKVLDFFIRTKRERQIDFNSRYSNQRIKTEIENQFGILIDIPQEINKSTSAKDFLWLTNDHPNTRQDIVIYSYPYTDKNTFTKAFLVAMRDSVMKANLPGELEGSYMGTELKYHDPVFKEVWVNGGYAAEIRGLWRMMNGAAMGGPYISHTRLDEINQRVITIEGFVFAPAVAKRNLIRQLEAVVYSAKLPQEINAIKEVSVVANKDAQ